MYYKDKYFGLINNRLCCSILLFLVSFAVFIPSLKNDFVWDDGPYIQDRIDYLKVEYQIHHLYPKKVKDSKKNKYFRPTLHLSLSLDNQIWKGSTIGFHLSNIIFHSISTVMIYLLFILVMSRFNIDGKNIISFFGSLLFALHPVHVESVSFIMARSDLLCAMFLFCSFIFYIRSYQKIIFLLVSAIFFYLALISKEVAFIFPVLIFLYDLLSPKRDLKVYILRYSFCALFFAVYLYYRSNAFVFIPEISKEILVNANGRFEIIIVVLKNLLNAYGYYTYKLVFPFYFNASPGRINPDIYLIAISLAVLGLLVYLIVRNFKRNEKILLFSLLWILLSIAPGVVASIFDLVTSPYAERFLYIPSAAYCVLIVYLIYRLSNHFRYNNIIFLVIVSSIAIGFSIFTLKEQSVWNNNLILWETTVKRSPDQTMPRLNYGYSLLQTGQNGLAIMELKKALNSKVGNSDELRVLSSNNLGNAYLNSGDYIQAEKYFKKALEFSPKYKATYYFHSGLIDFLKGNSIYYKDKDSAKSFYKGAERKLKKSYDRAPRHGQVNLLLAEVYLRLGKKNLARKHAKNSLYATRGLLNDVLRRRAQEIKNTE